MGWGGADFSVVVELGTGWGFEWITGVPDGNCPNPLKDTSIKDKKINDFITGFNWMTKLKLINNQELYKPKDEKKFTSLEKEHV